MIENKGGSIPTSNLTKLKRSLEYKSLRGIMAQHIKSHLKKKMILGEGLFFHDTFQYSMCDSAR